MSENKTTFKRCGKYKLSLQWFDDASRGYTYEPCIVLKEKSNGLINIFMTNTKNKITIHPNHIEVDNENTTC